MRAVTSGGTDSNGVSMVAISSRFGQDIVPVKSGQPAMIARRVIYTHGFIGVRVNVAIGSMIVRSSRRAGCRVTVTRYFISSEEKGMIK